MLVRRVRHDWPEKADFGINYGGHDYYAFFHFPIPFEIKINGELIHTRPNACVFMPPMAYRYFHCYQPSTHNFMFINRELTELLRQYDIPENQLLYPANTSFISDIFRKMELEFFSENPHRETLLDGYLEEFLIKLSRTIHNIHPLEVSVTEQIKMRNLRQEILSQCEKKWTVSQMAALASLSPSRFHAVYKSVFGSSPINDVTIAKINYAKTLLRADEHYSLQDITEMVGYQSQCHFINKFKAITGVTPGGYRKKYR